VRWPAAASDCQSTGDHSGPEKESNSRVLRLGEGLLTEPPTASIRRPRRTRASGGPTESQAALFEADKAALADDEVVQRLNVQQLARLDEHLGQAHVFGRRGGVAGGVVLNDDDRRRVVPDGVAEQLGHADDVGVEAADVDGRDAQNPIVRINSNCNTDLRYLYPDRLNCTPKATRGKRVGWNSRSGPTNVRCWPFRVQARQCCPLQQVRCPSLSAWSPPYPD
jgi:hypothetical protein